MTEVKPIGSYPSVYDTKVLPSISHTGTGGETHKFEVKQGGAKYKKRRANKSKRFRTSRKSRKTLRKKR
jgi:hypothetical protein